MEMGSEVSRPFCITFAGAAGSSKTPIAYHLSWNLGLPVFNNDAIRSEVREDLLKYDDDVYVARRNARLKQLISEEKSFIYDASVDRYWVDLQIMLDEHNFRYTIISMDLSKVLLLNLYSAKDYTAIDHLDTWIEQHDQFVQSHQDLIGLHIADDQFIDRLQLSLDFAGDYIRA